MVKRKEDCEMGGRDKEWIAESAIESLRLRKVATDFAAFYGERNDRNRQ